VGDFQYWQIRSVLQRVESPDQLHVIETSSPQIRGEDAELWKAFIARDIPNWKSKNYVPKNPQNWYKIYLKYKREKEEELARDQEQLRIAMSGLQKKKETNVSRIVDPKTLPKLPRDPRMLANNGGVPIGKKRGLQKSAPSSLLFTSGSKTKTTTAASVLLRARREAKDHSARTKLATPTHELGAAQVRRAPEAMVNEYKRAAAPPVKIFSKKRSATYSGSIGGPSQEDREKRLRALTMSASGSKTNHSDAVKATVVSDDDDDDIFGESEKQYLPPSPPRRPRPEAILRKGHTEQQPPSRRNLVTAYEAKPAPAPLPKPSDLVSSIVSKTKVPEEHKQLSEPNNTQPMGVSHRLGGSSGFRSASPASGPNAPRPMIVKRRQEVDIFNRGAKKPRAR
jgi:elongin-A